MQFKLTNDNKLAVLVDKAIRSHVSEHEAVIQSVNWVNKTVDLVFSKSQNIQKGIPFNNLPGSQRYIVPGFPVLVKHTEGSPVDFQVVGPAPVKGTAYPIGRYQAPINLTQNLAGQVKNGFNILPYSGYLNIGTHGGICIDSDGDFGGNSYVYYGNIYNFPSMRLGTTCDVQSGGVGFCRNNQSGQAWAGLVYVGEAGHLNDTFTALRIDPVAGINSARVDMLTLKHRIVSVTPAPVINIYKGTEISNWSALKKPALPAPSIGTDEFLLGYVMVCGFMKDWVNIADTGLAKQNFVSSAMIINANGAPTIPSVPFPNPIAEFPVFTVTSPTAASGNYATQLSGADRTFTIILDFGTSPSLIRPVSVTFSDNLTYSVANNTNTHNIGNIPTGSTANGINSLRVLPAVLELSGHWTSWVTLTIPAQGIGASQGYVINGINTTTLNYWPHTIYWSD